MKSIIFFVIGVLIHHSVHSQLDHELNAWYKFGFSTNSFNSTLDYSDSHPSPDVVWDEAQLLQEHSFNLEYKAEVWKKIKLYALGGFEIGATNYYIPIINFQGYQVGDINFHNTKAGYFFGIAKRFELYDSKVKIDIGYRIKDLYPFQRNANFSQDWTFSETRDWIEYKYSLDVNYRQRLGYTGSRYFYYSFLRGEPFVNIQFNLRDNWFLNLQVSYQRNNYLFYNYSVDVQYYLGDSPYPNAFGYIPERIKPYFKNNDLIYTSIGISYNFSKKKRKPTKLSD